MQQGVTAQSIAWAFTTFDESNWHPLTWISHMIDWKLYGNNPAGHHITNVCLHAANAVLLFLLLLYMTGYLGPFRNRRISLCAAPRACRIRCLDCRTQRCFVRIFLVRHLACLCMVCSQAILEAIRMDRLRLCLRSHVKADGRHSSLYPAVARLLAVAQNHLRPETRAQWFSSFWKLCMEKWPLFIMAAISSVITFIAQRAGGSVASFKPFPMWERICNAAISYCRYLRIMFWPDPLTAYYYYDRITSRYCCGGVIGHCAHPCYRLAGISARKNLIASSAGCGFWERLCPSSASCRLAIRPWPSAILMFP